MIHSLILVFAVCGLVAMVLGLDCECALLAIWRADYGSGCYTGDEILNLELFNEPESCQYVSYYSDGTNYSFWFNISECSPYAPYEAFEIDIYNTSTDSSLPGCADNELWISVKVVEGDCGIVPNPLNSEQEFTFAFFSCDDD